MSAVTNNDPSAWLDGRRRVHLIGVAGSGMSGIAGLLLALGHRVSGCDRVDSVEVERLRGLGLEFHTPQTAASVTGAEVVIHSSAIRPGNPAYDEAARLGLPLFRRAEALAVILARKRGIVVAGMHGKTTTASMAAHVLRECGLRPSHYIGAEIPILRSNAHWDPDGEWMVAEGDESDGTLRLYHPEWTILLNIEEEHLDFYKDIGAIREVYRALLDQTTGMILYCRDDEHARELCAGRPNTVSYGFAADADYRPDEIGVSGFQSSFRVLRAGVGLGTVILNVPGRHNVLNAMAVTALADRLGLEFQRISNALGTFRGARRRFEELYRSPDFVIVDDYGHHPTEIRATIGAAASEAGRRIVVLFQPHRYTRTRLLAEAFGTAFDRADILVVTEIYPAGEAPVEGVGGRTITDAVRRLGSVGEVHDVPDRRRLRVALGRMLRPGDLLLSLGAGDIHEVARLVAGDLLLRDLIAEAIGRGRVRMFEPMSARTTLRIGGPAQFWVEPESESGLAALLRLCAARGLPWTVVGRGSNLLVRDGGIPGVVIHLGQGEFDTVAVGDGVITAGAGVKLKRLSHAARDAGLGGFEWFEGIPGTVGGALRMNAGALGAETFGQVVAARCLDGEGRAITVRPGEIDVNYRDVPWFDGHVAVAATFSGRPGVAREEIVARLEESMARRKASQPAASSAGCIFRNPAECPAGRLIEELGLKGMRRGAVRISEVHGNFLVNDGGGSASDVLGLIEAIRREAAERRGIDLRTEVRIAGHAEERFV